MATGAPTAMPTEAATLLLAQWLSPAYPVGAFAYSHGLEWAVESGAVVDGETLQAWLRDVLEYGAGQSDALFLAAAYRARNGDAVGEVDAICRAFCPSGERLMETDRQGRAFCDVTAAIRTPDLGALAYPVAVGRAAALENLPLALTLRLFLQAFAGNLVAAGIRLAPVGQTDGQRILGALVPLIETLAERAHDGDLGSLSGTAFLADIASMKHETQYSRIFRT